MEYFNDKLAIYSSYHTTSVHAAIDIINCFNKLANFDETFYTINQQFTILLAVWKANSQESRNHWVRSNEFPPSKINSRHSCR